MDRYIVLHSLGVPPPLAQHCGMWIDLNAYLRLTDSDVEALKLVDLAPTLYGKEMVNTA